MDKSTLEKIDISVFEPTGRDMKYSYPELSQWDELDGLTQDEIRFCWLVGSKSSPVRRVSADKRVAEAARIIFGARRGSHSKAIRDMLKGKLPQKYSTAIQKFAVTSISHRVRAFMMALQIFDVYSDAVTNLSKMISDGMADDSDKSDDSVMFIEDLQKAAKTFDDIQGQIPRLLATIESAYGLSIGDAEEADNEIKANIDELEDDEE